MLSLWQCTLTHSVVIVAGDALTHSVVIVAGDTLTHSVVIVAGDPLTRNVVIVAAGTCVGASIDNQSELGMCGCKCRQSVRVWNVWVQV